MRSRTRAARPKAWTARTFLFLHFILDAYEFCVAKPQSVYVCTHKRMGRHLTGGAEKIFRENNNLP